MLRNGWEFWTSFRSPKGKKNTQKVPSMPLFCHTGSSLGRFHFWRRKWTPNPKFKLFQKLDSPRFLTSYPTPDLDLEKPSKSSLEKELHTGKMALRIGWKVANFAQKLCFSPSFLLVWLFLSYGQIDDVTWCKLMYYDVKMIKIDLIRYMHQL